MFLSSSFRISLFPRSFSPLTGQYIYNERRKKNSSKIENRNIENCEIGWDKVKYKAFIAIIHIDYIWLQWTMFIGQCVNGVHIACKSIAHNAPYSYECHLDWFDLQNSVNINRKIHSNNNSSKTKQIRTQCNRLSEMHRDLLLVSFRFVICFVRSQSEHSLLNGIAQTFTNYEIPQWMRMKTMMMMTSIELNVFAQQIARTRQIKNSIV